MDYGNSYARLEFSRLRTERFIYYSKSVLHLLKHMFHVEHRMLIKNAHRALLNQSEAHYECASDVHFGLPALSVKTLPFSGKASQRSQISQIAN